MAVKKAIRVLNFHFRQGWAMRCLIFSLLNMSLIAGKPKLPKKMVMANIKCRMYKCCKAPVCKLSEYKLNPALQKADTA